MSATSPQLVVLYCIIGAAASVTIGYSVSRLFGRNEEDATASNTLRRAHDAQRLHMRDVRMQNRLFAEQEAMSGTPGKMPRHVGAGVAGASSWRI
jgi:hypothetical protein